MEMKEAKMNKNEIKVIYWNISETHIYFFDFLIKSWYNNIIWYKYVDIQINIYSICKFCNTLSILKIFFFENNHK